MILTWKLSEKNPHSNVYTAAPGYRLIGALDPAHPLGPRKWSLEHEGVEIAAPSRISEAKRLAQLHHETMLSGAPRPRHAATAASLSARVADAIRDRFADRATGHVADLATEIADLAVSVLAEPWPDVDLSKCTHGADCDVHPDVHQLHNFDATAGDVLGAVLAAVQIRHKFDADDVRQIAAKYGVTLVR